MMGKDKIVYGINPIREYLKIIKEGQLFVKKSSINNKVKELIKKAEDKSIYISLLDDATFEKRFGKNTERNIILIIKDEYSDLIDEKDCIELIKRETLKTVLILDGIKDPGNFGAVLRSSLLFDVDLVILPKDNSCSITEVVVKRSSGAVFYLKIAYVTNLVRIIDNLKKAGFWVYAADKEGEEITSVDFTDKRAIIIGEEGKGIRALVKKNADFIVTIPTNKKIDSLNLSVSAGILLYQLFTKQGKK